MGEQIFFFNFLSISESKLYTTYTSIESVLLKMKSPLAFFGGRGGLEEYSPCRKLSSVHPRCESELGKRKLESHRNLHEGTALIFPKTKLAFLFLSLSLHSVAGEEGMGGNGGGGRGGERKRE